jgi:GT2 family glycosyltransferase
VITASVLIVTYNSSSTIERCLLSLNDQSFKNFEVLVLDNHSQDETKNIIGFLQPRLKFSFNSFYLHKNLGFAGGNNFLLRHATGLYIALLNPDAFADPRWLEAMVLIQESHSEVGICASKLLTADGTFIDSAGDGFSSVLKSFKRGEGKQPIAYMRTEPVFGACGGAALYRRSMIEEIGFFDDDFFLIHEDADINFRAQLTGWGVMFVHDAIVYHKIHGSMGKMTDVQVYYNLRNLEFVRIKNVAFSMFIKHVPELLIGIIAEFIYFVVLHGKLRVYFVAKKDVLKQFRLMYQKRLAVFKAGKVRTNQVEKLITSIWSPEFMWAKIKRFFFIHA